MEHPDKKYLTARQVCERYSVTTMTLHRWLHREELAFPRPITITRRRYFFEQEIIDWERKRAAASRETE